MTKYIASHFALFQVNTANDTLIIDIEFLSFEIRLEKTFVANWILRVWDFHRQNICIGLENLPKRFHVSISLSLDKSAIFNQKRDKVSNDSVIDPSCTGTAPAAAETKKIIIKTSACVICLRCDWKSKVDFYLDWTILSTSQSPTLGFRVCVFSLFHNVPKVLRF